MQKKFIPHQNIKVKKLLKNNKGKLSKKADFSAGFITKNANQTKKLGELLAQDLRGGEIICLSGELGAGKTTFTQGFLKGLKIKGPYTSPTFVIMKEYAPHPNPLLIKERGSCMIYHLDAYRVGVQDILNLGWEEIISNSRNIVIIEWAERIENIIPSNAIWIDFGWLEEKKRKITFKAKV